METVSQALTLAWKIVDSYQNAPKQRAKCKAMVEQVSRLGKLLEELKPILPTPMSPQTQLCFEGLGDTLKKAYRVMEKAAKASTLKYIFMSKGVAEDLSDVSNEIEAWLKSLPMIQLAQSAVIQDELRNLRSSFADIGRQLKEQTTCKEQQELAAEVLEILRSRNSADCQESNVDKLVSWLAERYESDVQTVRKELQDMKNDASHSQLESKSSKQSIEDELLQHIILCIDELESYKVGAVDPSGIPGEFGCPICYELMNCAVILPSGHSYCRACIDKLLTEGRGRASCPTTRRVFQADCVIDNISLRAAIIRWMKTWKDSPEETPTSTPTERTYEIDFVRSTITELESEKQIKLFRSLNCLVEIASSANGSSLICMLGGVTSLSKLLSSPDKMTTEKVAAILALMTSMTSRDVEGTGDILNEVFENCLDGLVPLLTRGTGMARLKAAETLTNLLSIPEVAEYLLSQVGLISSLAILATGSEEGMETCLKCVKKLAKNKDVNLNGTDSLISCLFDLSKLEEDHIKEASLVALKSVMGPAAARACSVLRYKKAIPHLVRFATSSAGSAQEASIMILEQYARYEGYKDLVEAGFCNHIRALISSSHLSGDMVILQAVFRLSAGYLESQQTQDVHLDGFQNLIPRLMGLLQTKDCAAELLPLLKAMCIRNNTLKELIVDNGGLQALQGLGASSISTFRKGALGLIKIFLQSSFCQEEFSKGGGIEMLSKIIQIEESADCVTEAIMSLRLLVSNSKLKQTVLEALDLDKVVSFLDVQFCDQCKDSAAHIALLLVAGRSSIRMTRHSFKQLVETLQHGHDLHIRRTAAEVLLLYATTRGGIAIDDLNTVGLRPFMEVADGGGDSYKDLLLCFIAGFSPGRAIFEAGGVSLLLDAFENKEYTHKAAVSIRKLVKDITESHAILREAGFGRMGAKILISGDCNESCVADIAGSLVSVYCNQSDFSKAEVIKALLEVLKRDGLSSDRKATAACSVASLVPFDDECSTLLRTRDMIEPLLLVMESGRPLEALELLHIMVEDSVIRSDLYSKGGVPSLIRCLSAECHRVQELSTNILLTMGRPNEAIPNYRVDEIRRSMISDGIIGCLTSILKEPNKASHFAVTNSACLIRNLNLAGKNTVGEESVLKALVEALKFYASGDGHIETLKYIYQALETFCGCRTSQMLLRSNLGTLLQSLQNDYGENDDAIKTCVVSILLQLMEDRNLCREVCNMLLLNSISSLKNILENRSCKKSALNLLRHVVRSGPSEERACRRMREEAFIEVLFSLKQLKEANEVLDLMKKYDKHSKRVISDAEKNFYPWLTKSRSSS